MSVKTLDLDTLLPRLGEVGRGPGQQSDYYPFGQEIPLTGTSDNQLKFNGKELQDEAKLDWYDYGARFYDPVIGRWHSVDPSAEKYYEWSPFNYVLNNPILNIDPKGDTVRVYVETTERTGHAWLSVGEGENMTVYTYGRYAGTNERPILPISLKVNLTIKAQNRQNLVKLQERNKPK